jgi:hypothetical protein
MALGSELYASFVYSQLKSAWEIHKLEFKPLISKFNVSVIDSSHMNITRLYGNVKTKLFYT